MFLASFTKGWAVIIMPQTSSHTLVSKLDFNTCLRNQFNVISVFWQDEYVATPKRIKWLLGANNSFWNMLEESQASVCFHSLYEHQTKYVHPALN